MPLPLLPANGHWVFVLRCSEMLNFPRRDHGNGIGEIQVEMLKLAITTIRASSSEIWSESPSLSEAERWTVAGLAHTLSFSGPNSSRFLSGHVNTY
jgi:hypothetical protein